MAMSPSGMSNSREGNLSARTLAIRTRGFSLVGLIATAMRKSASTAMGKTW